MSVTKVIHVKWIVLLICLSLLICLPLNASALEPGDRMPNYRFRTTEQGEQYTVSQLLENRQMILISFFTTWCGPCQIEFPMLQNTYEHWQDQASVIAVSAEPEDTSEVVSAFAESMDLTFPFVPGDVNNLADSLEITAYPTTLVVDRYGKIAMKLIGAQMSEDAFDRIFDYFCDPDYEGGAEFRSLPPSRAAQAPLEEDTLTALLTDDPRIQVHNRTHPFVWPFVAADGGGVSTAALNEDASVSELSATFVSEAEEVFSYRFSVSCEGLFDGLTVMLDQEIVRVFSGETGWQNDAIPVTPGEHEILFRYEKDGVGAEGQDQIRLMSFSLLKGDEAQKALESLPEYPKAELTEMTVLDDGADPVWVEDPTGVLQRLYGYTRIYVLDKEEADVRLTLDDGENPWTIGVSVNGDVPRMILPNQTREGYELTVPCSHTGVTMVTAFSITPDQQRMIASALIYPTVDSMDIMFSYFKAVYGASILWNLGSMDEQEEQLTSWRVVAQDQEGNPVPGCEVEFYTSDASAIVRTDENGEAVFEAAPYPYHVRLHTVPGAYWAPQNWNVSLPEEGGTTGIILVKRGGGI